MSGNLLCTLGKREVAMTKQAEGKSDTVIIKKYANRRLYNTQSSSYITLDHLSKMTREGWSSACSTPRAGPTSPTRS
jgi:hypothetical protein